LHEHPLCTPPRARGSAPGPLRRLTRPHSLRFAPFCEASDSKRHWYVRELTGWQPARPRHGWRKWACLRRTFNGWLIYNAVSALDCFNCQYDFKILCNKIIPFAAAARPCAILATPRLLTGDFGERTEYQTQENILNYIAFFFLIHPNLYVTVRT
jgi:hypothetical protein